MIKDAVVKALGFCLSESVINLLMHLSYHPAPSSFEHFVHLYGIDPHMQPGLKLLANRGFSSQTIIDVGACERDTLASLHLALMPLALLKMNAQGYKIEILERASEPLYTSVLTASRFSSGANDIFDSVAGP